MKVKSKYLDEYAQRMQHIVTRTDAITQIRRTVTDLPFIVVTEIVYLQLRHILELIATALFTVNKDVIISRSNSQFREWHALELLEEIEHSNPDFYPKPTRDGRRGADGVIPIVEKKGDYLSREKFTTLYRACGEVLHTPNPFSKKRTVKLETRDDCLRMIRSADRWQSRIVRLLTHHQFKVLGDETLYIAHTVGEKHVFHVTEFDPYTAD